MKYILLATVMLLSTSLFSQRKRTVRPVKLFKIQGAFLLDNNFEKTYTGVNLINVGWGKQKENIFQGIDLEFIKYKSDIQRTSIELSYFRTFRIYGEAKQGFYVGASAYTGYYQRKAISFTQNRLPFEEKCYCFGIGPKLDYLHSLNKRLYLNISTKFYLLDVGLIKTQEFEPNLLLSVQRSSSFGVDFIRKQFQIMLGVGIKL